MSLRLAAGGNTGGWSWREILGIKPRLMQAKIVARSECERQRLRIEAERAITGEIRRATEAEMKENLLPQVGGESRDGQAWRGASGSTGRAEGVTLWELRDWLELRNQHFELLRERRMAGGSVRVRPEEGMSEIIE